MNRIMLNIKNNMLFCDTKKRMTLVENSGFINELRQPKTAMVPGEDDFKIGNDEVAIQRRKQRNSRLTTILTDTIFKKNI